MKWKDYNASQFELKETTRQILKLRKHKALEFEIKLWLHVRFGIGKKTNLWILNLNFYYMSDSELKITTHWIFKWNFLYISDIVLKKKTLQILNLRFPRCRIWKKFAYKRITLPSFTPWIGQLLQFSCFSFVHVSEINSFYTSDFEMKRLQRVTIWIKKNNASDFYWKISQLVRFWIENFTKCQILNWRKIQRVRF